MYACRFTSYSRHLCRVHLFNGTSFAERISLLSLNSLIPLSSRGIDCTGRIFSFFPGNPKPPSRSPICRLFRPAETRNRRLPEQVVAEEPRSFEDPRFSPVAYLGNRGKTTTWWLIFWRFCQFAWQFRTSYCGGYPDVGSASMVNTAFCLGGGGLGHLVVF